MWILEICVGTVLGMCGVINEYKFETYEACRLQQFKVMESGQAVYAICLEKK